MSKILLFILLIAGLVVSLYLVGQKTGLFSRADISNYPQDIKISNLADNAFTISWITIKPTIGFVKYGENENLDGTANDDRDAKPRLTHHVTLKDLNPATKYYYQINSGKVTQQTTAPTTNDTPPLADPIFGQVVKDDKTIPSESIIYSQIGDGTLLSSYSRDDGNFLITLNNARTKDLANYLDVKDTDQVNFTVQIAEGSIEKQVPASGRSSVISLILDPAQVKKTVDSWPKDYNQDGVVNVFDFAIYLKNNR